MACRRPRRRIGGRRALRPLLPATRRLPRSALAGLVSRAQAVLSARSPAQTDSWRTAGSVDRADFLEIRHAASARTVRPDESNSRRFLSPIFGTWRTVGVHADSPLGQAVVCTRRRSALPAVPHHAHAHLSWPTRSRDSRGIRPPRL